MIQSVQNCKSAWIVIKDRLTMRPLSFRSGARWQIPGPCWLLILELMIFFLASCRVQITCNQFASSIEDQLQHRPVLPQNAGARMASHPTRNDDVISFSQCLPWSWTRTMKEGICLSCWFLVKLTWLPATSLKRTADLGALQLLPGHVLNAVQEN